MCDWAIHGTTHTMAQAQFGQTDCTDSTDSIDRVYTMVCDSRERELLALPLAHSTDCAIVADECMMEHTIDLVLAADYSMAANIRRSLAAIIHKQ